MKYLPALAIIVLALTLASCSSNSSSGGVFKGGTGGLVMSFESDTPPDLIYDNGQTPMPILLRVKNTGEFDTHGIQFRISGISTNDFPNLQPQQAYYESIAGVTKLGSDTIDGEEAFVTLADDSLVYPRSLKGGGELSFTIRVDACYPYATLATAKVCLKADYQDGETKACDPKKASVSTSSAPVQIENVQTTPIGRNKLRMTFDVVKKSNVDIWRPDSAQDCKGTSRSDRAQQLDRVYVRVDDNDPQKLIDCSTLIGSSTGGGLILSYDQKSLGQTGGSPTTNAILTGQVRNDADGLVRLSDGTASVSCILTSSPGVSDSVGTIDIALSYYVEDSISKQITITHTDSVSSGTSPGAPQAAAPSGSPSPSPTAAPTPSTPPHDPVPATSAQAASFSSSTFNNILSSCQTWGRSGYANPSAWFQSSNLQLNNGVGLRAQALAVCLQDTTGYPQNCGGTLHDSLSPTSTLSQAYNLLDQRAKDSLGQSEYSRFMALDPYGTKSSQQEYIDASVALCLKYIHSH